MVPTQQGSATAERRGELAGALGVIVAAAEQAAGASTSRLDQAVTRWSRDVGSPADVVSLVAEVRRGGRLSRAREEVLDRVAAVAVAAVAERQVRDALTDPLTGLATRARLEDELQHLLAMSLRAGNPLTAVILDVDGLKKINDEQGHAAGDAALAAVGTAIREHARKTDRAFRWGGDEFVVLMPGTSDEAARLVVQRIQDSCPTATTAGVATHTDGATDVDVATWLSAADADLYRRRSEMRSARAPRRTRRPILRSGSGAALLGVATIAAATGGWFGLSTVAHNAVDHPAAQAAAPVTRVIAPVVSAPVAVEPTTVLRSVTTVGRSHHLTTAPAPVAPVTPPLVPSVITQVVEVPVAPQLPTIEPIDMTPVTAAQPKGLVRSLLGTVNGVLSAVL